MGRLHAAAEKSCITLVTHDFWGRERHTSSEDSVTIHSEIGFYIRSSPRNTFVFYARDTVFSGDATVGLVRRQLLLDAGDHEGATSSLAAVATSFRLKRAMARIWFRATGEGELERSLGPGFPAIGGCSVGWASAIGVQRARHRQLHVRPVPLPRHLG